MASGAFGPRTRRGMFLVAATGSPKARRINTTSCEALSSPRRRRLLLLLPSLACGVYLDNLPLGGSGTRYGKGASSSRWLSPRWHRVPRLCIGDLLLLPVRLLLHLPLLSWPPCSSRRNFLASATPVRERPPGDSCNGLGGNTPRSKGPEEGIPRCSEGGQFRPAESWSQRERRSRGRASSRRKSSGAFAKHFDKSRVKVSPRRRHPEAGRPA